MVFTSSKRKKREKNVVSATKARWVIKKQSAQISEEHNYANAGTCNATSSLSLNLPDLNNIVADEEVDDVKADTDDSDDCESKHSSMPWDSGRRVVELGVLANALASCKNCTNPLQLSHATSIRTYGLAAILKVPCSNTNCRFVNNVPTGKQHGKTHIWDVNTKLANALIHAGVGVSQMNSILAALNIPQVQHKLVSKRQTEVGQAVEVVANSSVLECLEEECNATEKETGSKDICVSVDAGWQKRGSGKAYDSMSGHATMIGTRTGKVVGYSVRTKSCRVCSHASKTGTNPQPHDCKQNWNGSAKAMEQDMVVEMVKEKKLAGILRVIRYIQKCWAYMVAQNKHNPAGVEVGLDAMWKHPGSASLNYRVSAAVAQKNIGHTYVSKVNARIGLSPGSYTQRLAVLRDLQHRKRKALNTTRAAKRRRLELKAKRLQKSSCQETREGKTYSPEVDVCGEEADLTFIPPPCPSPVRVPVNISSEHVPVYFDLETTGLARTSHITQIAAAAGELHFSCYVFPRIAISSQSASVTGISVRNGIMYHHGKRVDSKSISTAVDMLLDFCQTFQKKIILVGHNVESFDSPILMYALDRCKKLESFTNIVDGFLDTLKFFRIERPGLSSYRQEYLCKNLAGIDYDAHDALSDVLSLQSLINFLNIGLENVNARTALLTSVSAVDFYRYSNVVQSNLPSLQPLIGQKIISCPIAKKIAGSGLQLKHLELAYSRDPVEGIYSLFSEQCGKSVRVSKSRKVTGKIVEYFASLRES
uniref:Exonuclease domain-containing protein n=1 Tax=Magallana gigas TaxID=29159 RepID=A0A8W8NYC9_MAGGI